MNAGDECGMLQARHTASRTSHLEWVDPSQDQDDQRKKGKDKGKVMHGRMLLIYG